MPKPRKSLEQHELQGTRPEWTARGLTFVGGKPKRPADLTPEAETEWKRLVNELNRRGTLTRVDSSMLELYVRMWSRWRKVATIAEANPVTEVSWLDKSGAEHFKTIEHPASAMATRLENSLRNMLKELSATPASRERTRPTKQASSKNDPPHPESVEGLKLEHARLLAEQEQKEAQEPAVQEPDPLDSTELNAAMEEHNDKA